MTDRSDSFDNSTIAAEACAWIAQLESGDVSRADLEALREWTKRSPRHAQEIKHYAHLWGDLDVLRDMAGPIDGALAQERQLMSRRRVLGMTPGLAGAAAALALVISGGAYIWTNSGGNKPAAPLMVSSAIGEQRTVSLPDGSTINVNTNSQLEIDFSDTQRKIRLLKGEALFHVAKDRQRPFVVYAGEEAVRAVGTAFAVRLNNDNIDVTVTEGTVELANVARIDHGPFNPDKFGKAEGDKAIAVMTAGHQAVAGSNRIGPIEKISAEEVQRKLAWKDGRLEFSGESLKDVIKEVSRYTSLDIVIDDPKLESLRFGGVFKIGQTQALFEALEQSFGVQVERRNDNTVLLTAAKRHS